jgi:hypothetical protein
MARIVHVLKRAPDDLAIATIRRQLDAGDHVVAVLVEGAGPDRLPDGVVVHRVPGETSYSHLVDLIFEADQVTAW